LRGFRKCSTSVGLYLMRRRRASPGGAS
jgi:hypothetical protein